MIAVTGAQAMWYLTRGTGFVALVLLTASLVLGIIQVSRYTSRRFPRFVTAALHKNVSLLVVVFLGVHIVTAIADGFAPIGWLDVVIPFRSPYRPLWLGLGAVAVDLLLAVVVTSLLRNRLGYRTFRAVHWISYACWPVAFLHGLGTGSDGRVLWSLVLSLACLSAVLGAVTLRLVVAHGVPIGRRAWTGAATAVLLFAVLTWTFTGPTQPGWARRAGTPSALLGRAVRTVPVSEALRAPFDSTLAGTIARAAESEGRARVTIYGSLSGGARGSVRFVLDGSPVAGGGIQMDRSEASLGTVAEPELYRGQVVQLAGTELRAALRNGSGDSLTLDVRLNVDAGTNAVTGSVSARGGI